GLYKVQRKRLLFFVILSLSLLILLAGCGSGKDNNNNGADKGKGPDNSNSSTGDFGAELPVNTELNGTVEFWGPMTSFFEETVVEFNKYYPNVTVDLINQGLDTTTKAQTAIAAGKGGPD